MDEEPPSPRPRGIRISRPGSLGSAAPSKSHDSRRCRISTAQPRGTWISGCQPRPPASRSSTRVVPSAVRPLASTHPAEPAPTITKSKRSSPPRAIAAVPQSCPAFLAAEADHSVRAHDRRRSSALKHPYSREPPIPDRGLSTQPRVGCPSNPACRAATQKIGIRSFLDLAPHPYANGWASAEPKSVKVCQGSGSIPLTY